MEGLTQGRVIKSISKIAVWALLIFLSGTSKAADYYWVGGSGALHDYANHWATTSGGNIFHTAEPDSNDNWIFDANSFTAPGQVVTENVMDHLEAKNFTCTGSLYPVLFDLDPNSATLKLHGDLVLDSNVTFTVLYLQCYDPVTTINLNTSGVHINMIDIDFSPAIGTVSLGSDFNCEEIYMDSCIFYSNNHNVIFHNFDHCSNSFVYFGTSTITCNGGVLDLTPIGFDLHADSCTIILGENPNFTDVFLYCYNQNYNKIISTGFGANTNFHISGAHNTINSIEVGSVFGSDLWLDTAHVNKIVCGAWISDFRCTGLDVDTLIFNPVSALPQAWFYTDGSTLTINNSLIINPNTNLELMADSNFIFYLNSGYVCTDSIRLENITATGGAQFYAGPHSTDYGGNSGWQFASCVDTSDYYWVGGSGEIHDFANHWATTSGGNVFHTSMPDSMDNVIFDVNSFTAPGQVVSETVLTDIVVRSFICTGTLYPVTFDFDAAYNLLLHGDLILDSNVTFTNYFEAAYIGMGQTFNLNTNNVHLYRVRFDLLSYGNVFLSSDLNCDQLVIANCTFNSNNYDINIKDLGFGTSIAGAITPEVYFGNSTITCHNDPNLTSNDLNLLGCNLHADSCTFVLQMGGSGQFYSMNQYFNKIINPTGVIINGNHCTANLLELTGLAYPTIDMDSSHIGKIICRTAVDFFSFKMDVDTLLLDSSHPWPIDFGPDGDTLTINKLLIITPDNYLKAYTNFTLYMDSGQVCTDSIKLENMIAAGGAQFYVGANSIDYGGNSGWQFIACTPSVSGVWPGDCNYDLTADNNDVLNIGLAYGEIGPGRTGASNAWVAQPASDWSSYFLSAINHKHADCDGNGTIDNLDTAAISLNYGLSHPFRLASPTNVNSWGLPFYVEPSADSIALTDTVYLDFVLGTSAQPVDSIYGIAFTFNFDTSLVNINGFTFDYSNSWMGTPGVNLLPYQYVRFNDGAIDFALVRTDHQNVFGSGAIVRIGIVIVDNVGARMNLPLTLSNVTAITYDESVLSLTLNSDSISVDTTAITGLSVNENNFRLTVFPNPAKEKFFITSSEEINSIEIYDMMNESVLSLSVNNKTAVVSTQKLRKGIYTAKIFTDKGFVNRKIVVMK